MFDSQHPRAIYTLSLHDALPIFARGRPRRRAAVDRRVRGGGLRARSPASAARRVAVGHDVHGLERHEAVADRSEEHTSELQSLTNLVCRLLLGIKNTRICNIHSS